MYWYLLLFSAGGSSSFCISCVYIIISVFQGQGRLYGMCAEVCACLHNMTESVTLEEQVVYGNKILYYNSSGSITRTPTLIWKLFRTMAEKGSHVHPFRVEQ